MWVTNTQTLFFPPMYMMERFARCDRIVLMQEAQHSRKAEHSWCLLSNAKGPVKVSLTCRNKNRRPLDEIRVLDLDRWSDRFEELLYNQYRSCPGYGELSSDLQDLFGWFRSVSPREPTLHEVSKFVMMWCSWMCGVHVDWLESRTLVPERPSSPVEWMAKLASRAGATDYVQGASSIRSYFEKGRFSPLGIKVWGQAWEMPEIPSLGTYDVQMCVLDTLLVNGSSWVKKTIGSEVGPGEDFGTVMSMPEYS